MRILSPLNIGELGIKPIRCGESPKVKGVENLKRLKAWSNSQAQTGARRTAQGKGILTFYDIEQILLLTTIFKIQENKDWEVALASHPTLSNKPITPANYIHF